MVAIAPDYQLRIHKFAQQASTTDDGTVEPVVFPTPSPVVDSIGDDYASAPAYTTPPPAIGDDEDPVDDSAGFPGFGATSPRLVGSTTAVLVAGIAAMSMAFLDT